MQMTLRELRGQYDLSRTNDQVEDVRFIDTIVGDWHNLGLSSHESSLACLSKIHTIMSLIRITL